MSARVLRTVPVPSDAEADQERRVWARRFVMFAAGHRELGDDLDVTWTLLAGLYLLPDGAWS